MIGTNDTTLKILQDRLEDTISTHQAVLSFNSRCLCDDDRTDKKEHCGAEEYYSDRETDDHRGKTDRIYVVDKILGHIGSGPRLQYVPRWYGYSKADDTAGRHHRIPQQFIDVYWRHRNKREKKNAIRGFREKT